MNEAQHFGAGRAVLLLALAACGPEVVGGEPAREAASAVAVRMAPVREATAAEPVRATGTVAPEEEIRLAFKSGGVIAALAVDEGARVRPGQVLATLDLREIDAQVSKARSALAKAERDLARTRALYRDSVATLSQLQDATTAAELARADVQTAAFNRRFGVITAPVGGTVLRRLAEAGEMVSPGQQILTLGAAGSGTVLRAGLADRDAVRVRRGDVASVRFDAFPDREFAGRVTQIAPAADPRTGTYEVKVSIGAGAGELSAGLIGRAEIRPSGAERVRLVPVEAVMEADGDRAVVYTLAADGRRARRVPVRIGALQNEAVVVHDGLGGVATVVTDGVAYLSDGTAVRRVP